MSTSSVSRRRSRLIACVVSLGVLTVVTWAMITPQLRPLVAPSDRIRCAENRQKIDRALAEYFSDHGRYPPSYTVDSDGNRLHSWRTLLLPDLGEQELYESIDFTKSWDDPANQRAYDTVVAVFQCPGIGADWTGTTFVDFHTGLGAPVTDYALAMWKAEAGERDPDNTDPRPRFNPNSNGPQLTNKISLDQAVHWMSPHGVRFETVSVQAMN